MFKHYTVNLPEGSQLVYIFCFVVLQETTEYLVLWSGYPKEAATWEAVKDITDPAVRYICEQLLLHRYSYVLLLTWLHEGLGSL